VEIDEEYERQGKLQEGRQKVTGGMAQLKKLKEELQQRIRWAVDADASDMHAWSCVCVCLYSGHPCVHKRTTHDTEPSVTHECLPRLSYQPSSQSIPSPPVHHPSALADQEHQLDAWLAEQSGKAEVHVDDAVDPADAPSRQ
jgi:hypothetical protein